MSALITGVHARYIARSPVASTDSSSMNKSAVRALSMAKVQDRHQTDVGRVACHNAAGNHTRRRVRGDLELVERVHSQL